MLQRKRKNKQLAEINVVPYIDVMLVLLVIFMITAPLLSQGVKVDLPKAAAQPLVSKQKEPIIVSVDAEGKYYLNTAADPSKAISSDDLAMQITSELKQNDNASEPRKVLVKGDKNVNYGSVIQVMALLQSAGVENVGLMTEPEMTPNKDKH